MGLEDRSFASVWTDLDLMECVSHINLTEYFGIIELVADLLRRLYMVLGPPDVRIERSGIYIHLNLSILLLRDYNIHDAVYGLGWVDWLYDAISCKLSQMS